MRLIRFVSPRETAVLLEHGRVDARLAPWAATDSRKERPIVSSGKRQVAIEPPPPPGILCFYQDDPDLRWAMPHHCWPLAVVVEVPEEQVIWEGTGTYISEDLIAEEVVGKEEWEEAGLTSYGWGDIVEIVVTIPDATFWEVMTDRWPLDPEIEAPDRVLALFGRKKAEGW